LRWGAQGTESQSPYNSATYSLLSNRGELRSENKPHPSIHLLPLQTCELWVRHGGTFHPVCHRFIFSRHLPQRRSVIFVGQAGSHAAALCRQFAQVSHLSRDVSHCKSLTDVPRLKIGTNTESFRTLFVRFPPRADYCPVAAFHPLRTLFSAGVVCREAFGLGRIRFGCGPGHRQASSVP
jgi:hypothetical protein